MELLVFKRLLRPRYFVYLLLFGVSLVNVISFADFSRSAHLAATGDAAKYIAMSEQTFAPVVNPFGLRLMSPFIVHGMMKLGLGLNFSWLLLTFTATVAALILFFVLLRDYLKLRFFTSTTCVLLLAMTYNYTLFNFFDFWLVDPLNNLFYMLALYLALTRRLWWFVGVVILGSINKETTVLLAPLYPLLVWGRQGSIRGREVFKGVLGAGIAMVAYLAFHSWAQRKIGSGASYEMLSGANGGSVLENVRTSLNAHKNGEHLEIFRVFQFIWAAFIYGLYRIYKEGGPRNEMLLASGYFLVAIVFGRIFAENVDRVYIMMAPVVLGVTAILFDRCISETQRLWMGVLVFLYIALNLKWVSGEAAIILNTVALVLLVVMFGMDRLRKPESKQLKDLPI